ncbi:hypothetical protein LIER_12219 [Lithospermum erythrorhizon]|uniref:Uncharacterized protein n=1 Tax=Lithospermum erythrorhizon TaxID=34254 RepID=A0AAV3PW35_LITER
MDELQLEGRLQEDSLKKDDVQTSNIAQAGSSSCSGLGKGRFEMFLETVGGIDNAKSDLEYYFNKAPSKGPRGA